MNEINLPEGMTGSSSVISDPQQELRLHKIGDSLFALSELKGSKLVYAFASTALAIYLETIAPLTVERPWLIQKEQNANGFIELALQLKLSNGSITILTNTGSIYETQKCDLKEPSLCRLDLVNPARRWNLGIGPKLSTMRLTPRLAQIIEDLSHTDDEILTRLRILRDELKSRSEDAPQNAPLTICGEFMSFVARKRPDGSTTIDSTY